jgi:hypothetical protein
VLVKRSDPEIPANYSQESTGYEGVDGHGHGNDGRFDGNNDDGFDGNGDDCDSDDGGQDHNDGGFDSEEGGVVGDSSSDVEDVEDTRSAEADEWVPKRKRDPFAEWMPILKQAIDTLQANCDDEICDFGTNHLMEFTATIQKMVCEKVPISKRQRVSSSICVSQSTRTKTHGTDKWKK